MPPFQTKFVINLEPAMMRRRATAYYEHNFYDYELEDINPDLINELLHDSREEVFYCKTALARARNIRNPEDLGVGLYSEADLQF